MSTSLAIIWCYFNGHKWKQKTDTNFIGNTGGISKMKLIKYKVCLRCGEAKDL